MPYPNPLKFPVTTQDYWAVAVLEGDLDTRSAAIETDRAFLKAIAKELSSSSSRFWGVDAGLWMTSFAGHGNPVEVSVVAPRDNFTKAFDGDAFMGHPTTINVAGREVIVKTVDEDAFREAMPEGAFRFDDLYHLHVEYFLGHCHHFALAAALVSDLPLGVMWDDMEYADRENGIKEMAHVFLKLPDGRIFDFDGIRTLDDMRKSIAGVCADQTSCGDLRIGDLHDFIENGWLDKYDTESHLQALDVIALDPVLFRAIESFAPGRLAAVRAELAESLGFEPEGERPWSNLPDAEESVATFAFA